MDELLKQLEKSLTHVNPSIKQIKRIENLRRGFKSLIPVLKENCEPNRGTHFGITCLEDSLMWMIKGIVLGNENDL